MKSLLKIRRKYLLIVMLICLVFIILITKDVFNKELMESDTFFYDFFVNKIRNQNLTTFMKIITNFGSAFVLLSICLMTILFVKNKRIGLYMTINLFLITLLNLFLKAVVQRPRPDGYQLIQESGYSFPSGHSMISVAFYGFIIYLVYKYIKDKRLRITLYTLLSLLSLLIGSSRIYLGVHYASDVITGGLISVIYLIIYLKLVSKKIKGEENEK